MAAMRGRRSGGKVNYCEVDGSSDGASDDPIVDEDFEDAGWRTRKRSPGSQGRLSGTAHKRANNAASGGGSKATKATIYLTDGSQSDSEPVKGEGSSKQAVHPARRRSSGSTLVAKAKGKAVMDAGSILQYAKKGVDNTRPRVGGLGRGGARGGDEVEVGVADGSGGSRERKLARACARGKDYRIDLLDSDDSACHNSTPDATDPSSSEEEEAPDSDFSAKQKVAKQKKGRALPRRWTRSSEGSGDADFQPGPRLAEYNRLADAAQKHRPRRAAAPAVGTLDISDTDEEEQAAPKPRSGGRLRKAVALSPEVEVIVEDLEDSDVEEGEHPSSAKNNKFASFRVKDWTKRHGANSVSCRGKLGSSKEEDAPFLPRTRSGARPRLGGQRLKQLTHSRGGRPNNSDSDESAESSGEEEYEEDEEDDSSIDLVDDVPRSKQKNNARCKVGSSDDDYENMDSEEADEDSEKDNEASDDSMALNGEVERILDSHYNEDKQLEVYLKFKGVSYRKAEWALADLVRAAGKETILRNFIDRKKAGLLEDDELTNGVHPDWLLSERIIARRCGPGKSPVTEYLVKWRGLGYAQATWEAETDLQDGDKGPLERFKLFNQKPRQRPINMMESDKVPTFCNGRVLRDYQLSSLKWLVHNWNSGVNCMLGDEMGLGKTAQSIAVLEHQRQFCNIIGPFLVIAPLTTLGHWQREIETWTDMNAVIYSGMADDRKRIQKYEFSYSSSGRGSRGAAKFNVLIIAYDTMLRDDSIIQSFNWETIIIDEAHRLKSTKSKTRCAIKNLDWRWLLLLTGTPIQNNLKELFSMLNLLNEEEYPDEEAFLEKYSGSPPTLEQVTCLQDQLKPLLLRRMKEDVETLPEKEEIVIWVELTERQQAYYKAIYGGHIATLLAGNSSKNLPNLRNLAMEVRKLCCHPCLCNGLEDDMKVRHRELCGENLSELDLLVQSSGKMLLLHKLLPKLKQEGHKVLIFSQFKIMLNVLEDYLRAMDYSCERIDGDVAQQRRQNAIDRFSKATGNDNSFVFLLSTRAGGAGITLTAADTVLIYDSDWNPQNDLQAMARCHRIGQTNEVKVYRLITHNSYEQHLFECASKKYGLEEAILGGISNPKDPTTNGKKILELLKHGAHAFTADAKAQGDAFAAENIDEILQNRAEKRQLGSRAGNSFSQVTFINKAAGSAENRAYWNTLLPASVQEHDRKVAAEAAQEILPRGRRCRRVQYAEKGFSGDDADFNPEEESDSQFVQVEDHGDSTGSSDLGLEHEGDSSKLRRGSRSGKASPNDCESVGRPWRVSDVSDLCETFVAMGEMHAPRVATQLGLTNPAFSDRTVQEILEVWNVLRVLIERAAELGRKRAAQQPAVQVPHMAGSLPSVSAVNIQAMSQANAAPVDFVAQQTHLLQNLQLPRLAAACFSSAQLIRKILENSTKFEASLQEHEALDRLLPRMCGNDALPQRTKTILEAVPKAAGLPSWWMPRYDVLLLRGAQKYGFYSHGRKDSYRKTALQKILLDPGVGFAEFIRPPPQESSAPAGGFGSEAGALDSGFGAVNVGDANNWSEPSTVLKVDWAKLQSGMMGRLGQLLRALAHPEAIQQSKPRRGKQNTTFPVPKNTGVQEQLKTPQRPDFLSPARLVGKLKTPASSHKKRARSPPQDATPLASLLRRASQKASALARERQVSTPASTPRPAKNSQGSSSKDGGREDSTSLGDVLSSEDQEMEDSASSGLVCQAVDGKRDKMVDAAANCASKRSDQACTPIPKSGKRKMRESPVCIPSSSSSDFDRARYAKSPRTMDLISPSSCRRSPRLAGKSASDCLERAALSPEPRAGSSIQDGCSPDKRTRVQPPESIQGSEAGKENLLVVAGDVGDACEQKAVGRSACQVVAAKNSPGGQALGNATVAPTSPRIEALRDTCAANSGRVQEATC